MTINIKATNIELTEAIKNYVEKKILAVESKLIEHPENAVAEVEVGKTTEHHHRGDVFRAEAVLGIGGKKFVAIAQMDDLYAAIDEMKDKLERELVRGKDKERTLFRKGAARIKELLRR